MKKHIGSSTAAVLFFFSVAGQAFDSSVHIVLFLGNSITYAGSYVTNTELCYSLWHPQQAITFINLGLPSETVSGLSETGHADGRFPRPDLHERLHRILAAIKPDVVIACYGMNDGIYLPFNENRFQRYKDGIQWLHDTLVRAAARVILLTPPIYDEALGNAPGYAQVLDSYSRWLLDQVKKQHWEVADLHNPMKKYLAAHRQSDAAFGVDGFALSNDGIHPGEAGHWLMTKHLLLHIGEKQAAGYTSINNVTKHHPNGAAIFKLLAERQSFMKDAWLTATGHLRPEMKIGLPLQEALSKAAVIGQQVKALLNNQTTP